MVVSSNIHLCADECLCLTHVLTPALLKGFSKMRLRDDPILTKELVTSLLRVSRRHIRTEFLNSLTRIGIRIRRRFGDHG